MLNTTLNVKSNNLQNILDYHSKKQQKPNKSKPMSTGHRTRKYFYIYCKNIKLFCKMDDLIIELCIWVL